MKIIILILAVLVANISFAISNELQKTNHFFDRADDKMSVLTSKSKTKLSSNDLRNYIINLNQGVSDLNFQIFNNTKIKDDEKLQILKEIKVRYQRNVDGLFNSYDAANSR